VLTSLINFCPRALLRFLTYWELWRFLFFLVWLQCTCCLKKECLISSCCSGAYLGTHLPTRYSTCCGFVS
jgi:hypothetical protein